MSRFWLRKLSIVLVLSLVLTSCFNTLALAYSSPDDPALQQIFLDAYNINGGYWDVGVPKDGSEIHRWSDRASDVWVQDFDKTTDGYGVRGAIVMRDAWTKAFWIHDTCGIWTYWLNSGGPIGPLGIPADNEKKAVPLSDGTWPVHQKFENGEVWHHHGGTFSGKTVRMSGPILQKFNDLGGLSSILVMPVSEEYDWNLGKRQDFENGNWVYWSTKTGAKVNYFGTVFHGGINAEGNRIFAQQSYPNITLGNSDLNFAWWGCGVTSLAMLMSYHGVDTDPKRLNESLKSREAGGFSGALLTWTEKSISVASAGQVKRTRNLTSGSADWVKRWEIIDNELANQRPVIAFANGAHYVLIVGKAKDGTYIINDSWDGDENIPFYENIKGLGQSTITQILTFEPSNGPVNTSKALSLNVNVKPNQPITNNATIAYGTTSTEINHEIIGSDLRVVLRAPDGTIISPENIPANVEHFKTSTTETYIIDYPTPGNWEMTLYPIDFPAEGEPVRIDVNVYGPSVTPDTIDPITTIGVIGTKGTNGWYVSDATVNLSASDSGGSGLNQTMVRIDSDAWGDYHGPFTLGEGKHTVEYYSTDFAGNAEATHAEHINIDKTPPVINGAPTTEPNIYNWYNHDVTIHFTATDNLSGPLWETKDVVISEEGINLSRTETVFDYAGNSASRTVGGTNGINIDKTPPVITISSPIHGFEYFLRQPVTADWLVIDSLSGVLESNGTTTSGALINTASVRDKTYTVFGKDYAFNDATKTHTYHVHYVFSGVLQPIEQDDSSIFKLGSTVPVKFQLMDYFRELLPEEEAQVVVAKIYLKKVSNTIAGDEVEAISTSAATTGNLFRYDPIAKQFIFNLGTKSLSKGTWQVRIELDDGSSKYINISLK